MTPHFLQGYLQRPEEACSIRNQTTGAVLASSILPAFDRRDRNRGLLGRDAMPAGAALILAPCSGIHTCFMRFAIDVLFVSRTGTVLRARRALRPWRLSMRPGAFAVIELAAGAANGTEPGHLIAIAVSG